MIVQFLKSTTIEGKRYAEGQIAEIDNDSAHTLIVSGIAKERTEGPGDPDMDDEG